MLKGFKNFLMPYPPAAARSAVMKARTVGCTETGHGVVTAASPGRCRRAVAIPMWVMRGGTTPCW